MPIRAFILTFVTEYQKVLRLLLYFMAIGILVSSASAEVVFTNLFSFPFGGTYGGQPHGRLVQDRNGNFYGTTEIGGQNNSGTIFKMTPKGRLVWSVSFTGENGANPEAGLVQDDFGFLYGTASGGGHYGNGTVFKISPEGRFIWFASFDGTNGANLEAELMEGRDGNLYGTTSAGGKYGLGTVFEINRQGRIKSLYSFSGYDDGAQPVSGLVRGDDGDFYGTTSHGGLIFAGVPDDYGGPFSDGPFGDGTVFKISPHGVLTTLYAFGSITNADGISLDGANPSGRLTQGDDHNFYGTTGKGGYSYAGTVFKITPNGILLWSYSFDITHGSQPYAGLAQGRDGDFYGTTTFGGANDISGYYEVSDFGTVFKITPDGDFSTLYSFGLETDLNGNPLDGAFPFAGLTMGTDGALYGSTAGGYVNPGIIFRLSIPKSVCRNK
jgi:uncharacterized repeat protein (TIGR03803 family)